MMRPVALTACRSRPERAPQAHGHGNTRGRAMRRTLYVMERHDQLLDVWRELDADNLGVAHLDFHCDMRGLLVDGAAGLAHLPVWGLPPLDEGNFIGHALVEGRIAAIRWVHDLPGGRRDDVNGVRLASDLTLRLNPFARRRHQAVGRPFGYATITLDRWRGLEPGEFLDIDWDLFACLE